MSEVIELIYPGGCYRIDADFKITRVRDGTDWAEYCDSPIESQMLGAIVRAFFRHCRNVPIVVVRDTWLSPYNPYTWHGIFGDGVFVHTQAPVLKYRADILIILRRNGNDVALAIECDGHEWHEKTKEQARRDKTKERKIKLCGVDVMRFTGSEIFNYADTCAADVKSRCQQLCLDNTLERANALAAEAKAGRSRRTRMATPKQQETMDRLAAGGTAPLLRDTY